MNTETNGHTNLEFSPRLLAADFDETMAITSETAPNGMTVASAYRRAISRVLGDNRLARYDAEGGLRNRAASEVVADLVPEGTPDDAIRWRTEELIESKLEVLASQVGVRLPGGEFWPRPVEGFPEVWQAISDAPDVNTGVTSSGHRLFIERFCEVQELPAPDVMVTDDDMRPLIGPLPNRLCVKPSPLIIELLQDRWLDHLGIAPEERTQHLYQLARKRIVGVGDNGNNKDSDLADNAGIEFIEITPTNPQTGWQAVGKLLVPHVYEEVAGV